jgi:hypothetical protein
MWPLSSLRRICPYFALTLGAATFVSAADSAATSAPAKPLELFNGRDLAGWTVYNDPTKESAVVWTAADGVIRCAGKPRGYLRTDQTFKNYRLRLQWRWSGQPGNSGVFLHGSEADKVWPHCYEAQLQAGNAGELRCNGGAHFQPDSPPAEKSRPKLAASSERPAGEWNDYEIICQGDRVSLTINGVLQNRLEHAALTSGWIGLQAEGGAIEFRALTLESLPNTSP